MSADGCPEDRSLHDRLSPMPDPSDEQALIHRLRMGDSHALEGLIRQYAARLEDYAYLIVHADDLARDVVQDVFVSLWEQRARLEIRGSAASYLYRAVRYRAISVMRHEKAQHRAEDIVSAGYTSAPPVTNAGEQAIEEREFWVCVDAALNSLPPRCREIYLLHRDQELSYEQISELLGISNATIRNQIARAVARILAYLNDR